MRIPPNHGFDTIDVHAFHPGRCSLSAKVRVFVGALVERLNAPDSGQALGAPGWIRTSGHKLRRLVLYPSELRARVAATGSVDCAGSEPRS